MKITIKHEDRNGSEYGYGLYINAYITNEWDNTALYASDCLPPNSSDESVKKTERRVRQNARRAYKRDQETQEG